MAEAEAMRPFDLARGVWRSCLLELGRDQRWLLLTLHHIASDGWSIEILVRELEALYPAFAAGKPARLPELPVQYGDFAVWQSAWLASGALEGQLAYWRERLAGLSLLDLPADRPRPARSSWRGGQVPVILPPALVEGLRDRGRQHGCTLFMVLLASFQILLARCCDQEDIAVGSPVANRARPETEGVIGLFVNTLVLRGDLSGNPRGPVLLHRTREARWERTPIRTCPSRSWSRS